MGFRRFLTVLILAALLAGAFAVPNALAEYNMPFYIEVDITNQIVTVYKTEDDSIVRQMICSSGANDCTPLGDYYMCAAKSGRERTPWMPLSIYNCFVKYGSRIVRGILFHSIPFAHRNNSTMDMDAYNALGTPASHGCIRLRVEDSKFIADYCLRGTFVHIYKSGEVNEELRQMLLVSTYKVEDGIPYMEFMGYSETELGRGSTGERVSDIQARMRALGYYDGEINATYDMQTIAAVKEIQGQLGLAQNGIATESFQSELFSDAAPVSQGTITLREGWSGPVVEKLQQSLADLDLYKGVMDGVYDVEVSDAVKAFQSACGYSADGIAAPEIQHAIYYVLEDIRKTLQTDEALTAEIVTETINVCRINNGKPLSVREKPDLSAKVVARLRPGEMAIVLRSNDEWAELVVKGVQGYARHKHLTPGTQENSLIRYSAGENEYTLGLTLEQYLACGKSIAETFSADYLSKSFETIDAEENRYVRVNTGEDDVTLNLRAEPDAGAEVTAQVPNGTLLRVLAEQDGWTRVAFQDQIGYLLNDYLVVEEAADAGEESEAEEAVTALVLGVENGKAPVYASNSAESALLGHLPADTRVEVKAVDEGEGWVNIVLEGREGWMLDAHLKFEM